MNKPNLQKGFTVPVAIAVIILVAVGAIYAVSKGGPSSGTITSTSTDASTSVTTSTAKSSTTAGTKPVTAPALKPTPVYNPAPGQAVITSVTPLGSDGKFYSEGKILIKGRNLGLCNYPTTSAGCYIRAAIGKRDGAVLYGTLDQTSLTVNLPPLDPGTYDVSLQYPTDKNRKQSNYFPITVTGVPIPAVTVNSPNGGEIFKMGNEMSIAWKTSGPMPAKYWTLVTLGSNTGGLIKISDSTQFNSLNWIIPTRIQYKTSILDIAPGSYKVTVGVYDGPICFGPCTSGETNTGKLIAKDESDAPFTIAGINANIY